MIDLTHLNPPQREAVLHEGGPLVVFAGAGSGKTRVITYRVANLVGQHRIDPWRVLAVTFTNKAAGEMRERLGDLLGGIAGSLEVGTFHATCARLLRRNAERVGIGSDFTIYDDQDQQALVRRVCRDLGIDEKRHPAKQLAGRINRAKQELITPQEFETEDAFSEIVQRVYREYEERLKKANAVDFGGLISEFVYALERDDELRSSLSERYQHLLVDEFQDTNHAQFRLVQALCETHRNVCVVGDDDQSIYRWRGADRRNILDFKNGYPDASIIKLEQNYRSTKRILRVAYSIISRNKDREPKELWTDNEEGASIVIVRTMDERDEARTILSGINELIKQGRSLGDVVVFYRIHAQSRVIEEALRAANVAYRIVGGQRFYDRAEVKDVLAYLRVIQNPADDVSLLRIINKPTRGIGKTTIDRLLDAAAESGQSVWETLCDDVVVAQFGSAAQKRLKQFKGMMQTLKIDADGGLSIAELGTEIVSRSGYLEVLRADDTPEADARMQNLHELIASMDQFETEREEDSGLAAYLENITLHTKADETEDGDRVTLMTVHAAKGLEFPVVMVSGLEEQMFPFKGVDPWEDPEELEEERRLAYVAFTRAKERLILSFASMRRVFGQQRVGIPSRFLSELPQEDVEWIGMPTAQPKETFQFQFPGKKEPPPRDFDERVVDMDDGYDLSDEDTLRRGMKVRHPKFGVGEIREVMMGDPPRVSVRFDGWGVRKIVASYLMPA